MEGASVKRLLLAGLLALVCATSVLASPIALDSVLVGGCGGTLVAVPSTFTGITCVGQYDGNTPAEWDGSPEILKWNVGETYPTYFTIDSIYETGGQFTYSGPLVLRFVAIKYGNFYDMWNVEPGVNTGTFAWTTGDFLNNAGKSVTLGTSHITLYDTATVPEPGSTALMLGVGLLGLWKARQHLP